jgi:hypothetical protein
MDTRVKPAYDVLRTERYRRTAIAPVWTLTTRVKATGAVSITAVTVSRP